MNRKDEIEAVKRLGEQIGYGNMMDVASALWSIDLTSIDGRERIAHIPTVTECMKKKDAQAAIFVLRARADEIKRLGL